MDVSLLDAGILAALGYGVVFAGLIVLMIVIILVGKERGGAKSDPEVKVDVRGFMELESRI